MKRFFLAASIFAVSVVPAAAQSWTGGYTGVSGGYGWGNSAQTDPGVPRPLTPSEPLGDGHYNVNGGMVGETLGYNWQRGMWVFGVESDISWTDIKGQSNVCGLTTVTPHPCGTNLDALATFRGRVGAAVGPSSNWLLYATGGVAVGNLYGWDSLTPASGHDWRAGWAAGVGVEYAFAPRWSAKLEYLHVDLGNGQIFNIVPGVAEAVSFRADTVRVGVNYNFGPPSVAAPSPPMYTKIPTKAPPIAVVDPWSGWYAGLNAGYIDDPNTINNTAAITSTSTFPGNTIAMVASATQLLTTPGRNGFTGGAQVGYNYVVAPKVIAGWEADIQSSQLRGSAVGTSSVTTTGGFFNDTAVTGIAAARSLDWIGTVRARIGGVVTPSLLLYATGGLAYGDVRSNAIVTQTFRPFFPFLTVPVNVSGGSFAATRAGYTVGAGGEWMFYSKWSAKLEYLYYDLGSAHYGTGISQFDAAAVLSNGFGIDAINTTSHVRFNGNIVRAGVNYHFN